MADEMLGTLAAITAAIAHILEKRGIMSTAEFGEELCVIAAGLGQSTEAELVRAIGLGIMGRKAN